MLALQVSLGGGLLTLLVGHHGQRLDLGDCYCWEPKKLISKKNLANQPGEEGAQEEGEQGIACESEHFGSDCSGWREPPFRPAHTIGFLFTRIKNILMGTAIQMGEIK